ncbi:MAG: MarR family transcriptional regulator [Candidatus Omnitrophica bacterium]|nr:MarR family transcriptional regulator [Candidatus Omnitrophota bacterium]MDE2008630.1 MarR family transcriptional regulator [Candidatus Omnitrophota bacterium]MDE2214987.1 MarR family transcriptional regulator [Candidatus Omnitrophota bacterium]MDE2230926.1 MarR family transcriptional regulator [Candidatus Omnitrophota bacterium]
MNNSLCELYIDKSYAQSVFLWYDESMPLHSNLKNDLKGRGQIAFLLSQIGAHVAYKFAEKIRPLGLSPAHGGIIRFLGRSGGISQKKLCTGLAILPSRLVVLMDELEEKKIVERRKDPKDRRNYALYLTKKGAHLLGGLKKIAGEHGDQVCKGLKKSEQKILGEILSKIIEAQGLTPGIHPGFKRLGKPEC